MRLFILLVTVPIIEIALFIEIGGWLGTWPTIGIVVLTAILGSVLLRRQGLAALGNLQSRLQRGESPEHLLADGAMILVAGVLLMTPGFFTDALGLALLFPGVRQRIWGWISSRMTVVSFGAANMHSPPPADNGTIDGEYEEIGPSSPHKDQG